MVTRLLDWMNDLLSRFGWASAIIIPIGVLLALYWLINATHHGH